MTATPPAVNLEKAPKDVADTGESAGLDPAPDADTDVAHDGLRAQRWFRSLIAVTFLGLLAAGAFMAGIRADDAEAADRAAAVDVARSVADRLVTLTAQNAPAHVDEMLRLSTDPYRQQLVSLSTVFQEILKQGQVAAAGRVDTIGIETGEPGSYTVLAAARTTVRNTEVPAGAMRYYRLSIGVRKVDDTWLVSSVDVVR